MAKLLDGDDGSSCGCPRPFRGGRQSRRRAYQLVLVEVALSAHHGYVLHRRNFSANPKERGGTRVNVTGMRPLECPVKIVASSTVHNSSQFVQGLPAVSPNA